MLAQARREYEKKIEAVRAELPRRLEGLPDNPKIHRFSKNCYVMNSKDLENNWSAEYYDWAYQYRVLSGAIQTKDFRSACVLLVHVIRHRSVPLRQLGPFGRGSDGRMVFHPEVRRTLRSVYLGKPV